MDGLVPHAREDVHRGGVPPVEVELAVGESGDFGKPVADALEHDVEDQQVVDHHRYGELEEGSQEGVSAVGVKGIIQCSVMT